MKRYILCLTRLVFIICLISGCKTNTNNNFSVDFSSTSSVVSGTVNGYQYEIIGDGIKIISHNYNNDISITVPEVIAGKFVKSLGTDAFYQHKNTISITLPQTLTTIEGGPFYRCYSLEQIIIPKNVEIIDTNPFFRCSSLKMISVDSSNESFCDIDGVLFNKDRTFLISYPEGKDSPNYTVPASVKRIDIDSFGYHTKIRRLTIMANVVEFPEENMFVFPDDIVLVVEAGSMAEKYAKKHNLKFEYLE